MKKADADFKIIPTVLIAIAEQIKKCGGECYLVGGWVRDFQLGIPGRDYDAEVYGLSEQELLSILMQFGKPATMGKAFGVIALMRKDVRMDFSFPRTESKSGVGHRAFEVTTNPNMDFTTASRRRDFTINAMGMRLPDFKLVDPHGGQADLQSRILRHVGPAFVEDSLRVLRAVQFAARFDLDMHPDTVALCKSLDLSDLSRERIHEEFRKWLLRSSKPSKGLQCFAQMELYKHFPQINAANAGLDWETFGWLLDGAAALSITGKEREMVVFAALCLPGGRKAAEEFLSFLTLEQPLLRQVPSLVRNVEILLEESIDGLLSDEFLRRMALEVKPCLLLPLAKIWQEALTGRQWPGAQILEMRWKSLGIWEIAPEPFLKGRDLLELGIPAGRQMGELLKAVFEEQIRGTIREKYEALEWVRQEFNRT